MDFLSYGHQKTSLDKAVKKSTVLEHLSTVNMLKGPKHC